MCEWQGTDVQEWEPVPIARRFQFGYIVRRDGTRNPYWFLRLPAYQMQRSWHTDMPGWHVLIAVSRDHKFPEFRWVAE